MVVKICMLSDRLYIHTTWAFVYHQDLIFSCWARMATKCVSSKHVERTITEDRITIRSGLLSIRISLTSHLDSPLKLYHSTSDYTRALTRRLDISNLQYRSVHALYDPNSWSLNTCEYDQTLVFFKYHRDGPCIVVQIWSQA